ncbi:MAG: hypothetical protein HYR94_08795 [Chloroflexi bacterium]|nr:hypothetical protein [Chloroflexota bacterium]
MEIVETNRRSNPNAPSCNLTARLLILGVVVGLFVCARAMPSLPFNPGAVQLSQTYQIQFNLCPAHNGDFIIEGVVTNPRYTANNEIFLPTITGDQRPLTGCLLSVAGLPSPVPGLLHKDQ